MKIRYSYTEYKDYPEATEISKLRGILFTFYSIALGFGFFNSIVLLTLDFIANWYIGIPGIILCLLGFWYLVTGYDEVTKRKIALAIERQNQQETENELDEEYLCLYICRLENYKGGYCEKCSKNSRKLRECTVREKHGKNNVFICESCINKYMDNKITKF